MQIPAGYKNDTSQIGSNPYRVYRRQASALKTDDSADILSDPVGQLISLFMSGDDRETPERSLLDSEYQA